MALVSAGLLMCRRQGQGIELLLVHPGGPFFVKKDDGVWTIPKGLPEPGEELIDAARREFVEETGFAIGTDALEPLGSVRQKSGKIVHAWAFLGDCDPGQLRSNTFELEWPPRSGRRREFPEVDRAEFFDPERARKKIIAAQQPIIDRAVAAFG